MLFFCDKNVVKNILVTTYVILAVILAI